MKTLTEFSGFVLKEAMAKKTTLLAEGKTEEEIQTLINEQLKLDEAKSAFYKNVIDMTQSRMDRVKRVVVAVRATETEKVPESYVEREGHFYLVEYFPDANARGRTSGRDDDRRFSRGDRKGGGRGNPRNSDRGGSDRGSRPDQRERFERSESPRVPRPEGTFAAKREGDPGNSPARAPRPPRPERKPRPPAGERKPRAPRGPRGLGELRLVLKGQSATTLAGSGPAQTAAEAQGTSATPSEAPSA